jgi:hypothetical protein
MANATRPVDGNTPATDERAWVDGYAAALNDLHEIKRTQPVEFPTILGAWLDMPRRVARLAWRRHRAS